MKNVLTMKNLLLPLTLIVVFGMGWLANVIYQDTNGAVYASRLKWFGNGRFPGVKTYGPTLRDTRTGDYAGVVLGICREPRSKSLTAYQVSTARTSNDSSSKLVLPDNVMLEGY